jgi:hypothetical protein
MDTVDWSLAHVTIRQTAEPYVAGQIRTFTCPPVNDTGFLCDGTLAGGGTFQVLARRAPDQVLNVTRISYGNEHPSAFFNAVRDYIKPDAPLRSVRCELLTDSKPDLFSCDAIDANGTPTPLNVGKQADGSMRIYGIVIQIAETEAGAQWPLYAGISALILGALLLAFGLVQILRVRRRLVIATLPLVPEQRVTFPAAGDYVLHADGPLLSTLFAGLQYSLADTATGTPVSSFPAIMRAHTSSFTRSRMALRRFFVQREGEHVLRVSGLRPDRDASAANVVFSKSWPPLALLWIALAIGGGICLFIGLFLFIVAIG